MIHPTAIVQGVKACKRCGEAKPLDAFPLNGRGYRRPDCGECHSKRVMEYQRVSADTVRPYRQRRSQVIRVEVLAHYGGPVPRCACCGQSDVRFLCIDHINGGGRAHRRSLKSQSVYAWLKRNSYPEGFQVLCHNCNMAKGFYKDCPHATEAGRANLREFGDGHASWNAVVEPTVKLGIGSVVWDFAKVRGGVVTGRHVSIGGGAEIGMGCRLGDRVRVSFGVFLPNHTVVEDDVFLGPRVVACDDRFPKTNNPQYRAEPPVFRRGCSVGAGAVILPGVEVGEGALVGAGAVVTKDVAPYSVVVGNPARVLVREAAPCR